jgi:carbon storage regulator
MLIIQRKLNQSIKIGDDIEIVVVKTGDNSIKLGINAPKEVRVKRTEDTSDEKE